METGEMKGPMLEIAVAGAATLIVAAKTVCAWRAPIGEEGQLWKRVIEHIGSLALIKKQEKVERLRRELLTIGIRDRSAVELYQGVHVLAAATGCLCAWAIIALFGTTQMSLAPAAFFLVAGYAAVPHLLRTRKEKRQRAILKVLPGAVDLLVTCMEAGLGLEQALSRVAADLDLFEPVLASELRVTVSEMQGGLSVPDAMRRMGERIALEDLEMLSTVVSQASLMGAKIGQSLRDYSAASRRRRMATLDERTGKMKTLLSLPIMLCLAPAVLIILMAPAISWMMK